MAKTKTTKEEPLTNKVENTADVKGFSLEIEELKSMFLEMKQNNENLMKQNQDLQEKIISLEEEKNRMAVPLQTGVLMPQNDEKVYVVHMCEMMGGLTTHISLSDTSRDLRRLGEIMTLSQSQFEELKGRYLHYFEKGILAIDARNVELATMNHLPVYDTVTQGLYNPQVINDLGKMSNSQLQELYENLSYQNQQNIIGVWLYKCYNKDPNYLNRNKLEFLSKLTGGSDFDDIIFELIESEKRNLQKAMPIQNIGTV